MPVELGSPVYERIDAVATPAQKAALLELLPADVEASQLAGHPIQTMLTTARGNGATIGGSTTAAPGSVPTPSVNGVTVPVAVAAAKKTTKKPLTRAQRLANCTKTANKLKTAKKRAAARASCTKRFGKKKAPAKQKA